MTHPEHPSDDHLTGFEAGLASLQPTSAGPSAADVAYETGRRDAVAQQRTTLWAHRALTAAAVLVASGAGISSLLRPSAQAPIVVAQDAINEQSTTAQATPAPPPGPHWTNRALAHSAAASPYSYLSLRDAMLSDTTNTDLGRAAAPTASPAGGQSQAPSLADLLRAQRGM